MAKRILVGGGTGFIGKHLNELLKSKGFNVVNVSRMPAASNISWSTLDVNGLPENTKAVVNLAGQQTMDFTKAWSPGFKQNVINSRVFTTRALAKAINKTESSKKPSCFVVVTGVGAYEPSTEKIYDEDSEVKGNDFFSKLCVDWENAAKEVESPVRLVLIRSGVVLGRWGGMIKNMITPFYFGLGGRIGSGKQHLPWIHIEDLTRLITFAIENNKVSGVINGVAPQIITNAEFTSSFARALRRPAFLPVPTAVLNYLLHPERASMLTSGQQVISKRASDLGFNFTYDNIDKACEQCVNHGIKQKVPLPKKTSKPWYFVLSSFGRGRKSI